MKRTPVILATSVIAVLATPGLAVSATEPRGQTEARGEVVAQASRMEVVAQAKPTLTWPRSAGWYENSAKVANGYGHIFNWSNDQDGHVVYAPYGYLFKGNKYWTVYTWYYNHGTRSLSFSCAGFESPRVIKEHIYRGGRYIGWVPADRTFCSTGGGGFTLQPGKGHWSWARFHNVPAIEDHVVIEWGSYGKGAPAVKLWARKR